MRNRRTARSRRRDGILCRIGRAFGPGGCPLHQGKNTADPGEEKKEAAAFNMEKIDKFFLELEQEDRQVRQFLCWRPNLV